MIVLSYVAFASLAYVLIAEGQRLMTTKPPYFKEMIEYINSQNASWRAGPTHIPDLSWQELRFLVGSQLEEPENIIEYLSYMQEAEDIPESFDARENWPGFIHPIRDQGKCGSCWAFGAVEAMGDRLAIFSKGTVNITLSPEQLVSCAPFPNMGCQGGQPYFAWRYLKNHGVVSESCNPYTAGESSLAPSCRKSFREKDCFVYKLSTFYKVGSRLFGTSQKDIQRELMKNGPVEAVFRVHSDFLVYKSGVYEHISGPMVGGHAVKIIGWGVEGETPYWLIANSWGTSWGENGFFRIKRGANECGIESMIYAGIPDSHSVSFETTEVELTLK